MAQGTKSKYILGALTFIINLVMFYIYFKEGTLFGLQGWLWHYIKMSFLIGASAYTALIEGCIYNKEDSLFPDVLFGASAVGLLALFCRWKVLAGFIIFPFTVLGAICYWMIFICKWILEILLSKTISTIFEYIAVMVLGGFIGLFINEMVADYGGIIIEMIFQQQKRASGKNILKSDDLELDDGESGEWNSPNEEDSSENDSEKGIKDEKGKLIIFDGDTGDQISKYPLALKNHLDKGYSFHVSIEDCRTEVIRREVKEVKRVVRIDGGYYYPNYCYDNSKHTIFHFRGSCYCSMDESIKKQLDIFGKTEFEKSFADDKLVRVTKKEYDAYLEYKQESQNAKKEYKKMSQRASDEYKMRALQVRKEIEEVKVSSFDPKDPCVGYYLPQMAFLEYVMLDDHEGYINLFWSEKTSKAAVLAILNEKKYVSHRLDYAPNKGTGNSELLVERYLYMMGQEALNVKQDGLKLVVDLPQNSDLDDSYFDKYGSILLEESEVKQIHGQNLLGIAEFLLKKEDFGAINIHHFRVEYVRDALREYLEYDKSDSIRTAVQAFQKFTNQLSQLSPIFQNCTVYGELSPMLEYIGQKAIGDGFNRLQTSDTLLKTDGIANNMLEQYVIILWKKALLADKEERYYNSFIKALCYYNFYSEILYFYHHVNEDNVFVDYNGDLMIDKDGKSRSRITMRIPRVEALLADIYVKKNKGELEGIEKEIDLWLWHYTKSKAQQDQRSMYFLASGLCWMELYDLEERVLSQIVRVTNYERDFLKQRFSMLKRGIRSEIRKERDEDCFYFISVSEGWSDRDIQEYFRSGRKDFLTPILLARKVEKKSLERGKIVDIDAIYQKLQTLEEDFGGNMSCRIIFARAVDNASEDYGPAALFQFSGKRNHGLTILLDLSKCGLNLMVTMLILFSPEGSMDKTHISDYALAVKGNHSSDILYEMVDEILWHEIVEKDLCSG